MAMSKADSQASGQLSRHHALWAGLYSIILGLLGLAWVVSRLLIGQEQSLLEVAHFLAWILLLTIVVAAGVRLLRGGPGAQGLLLVVFLLLASGLVVAGAYLVIGDRAEQAAAQPGLALTGGLAGVLCILAIVSLVGASAAGSRLRYASVVSVSVAVAVVLVILVNMIAQKDYYRRDVESLGRYGLSDRSRKILAGLETPVQLTCAYASREPGKPAADYRPRVWELLAEMAEYSSQTKAFDASNPRAMAEVVDRLREKFGGQAKPHEDLLRQVSARAEAIQDQIEIEQRRWERITEESYLAMWGAMAQVPQVLDRSQQEIKQLAPKLNYELSDSTLPDYAGLVKEAKDKLQSLSAELDVRAKALEKLARLPEAVLANRPEAIEAIDAAVRAVEELVENLGGEKSAAPEEATGLLDAFVVSAVEAAAAARQAGEQLKNVAGQDNAEWVVQSRYCQVSIPSGAFDIRTDLPDVFESFIARELLTLAEEVKSIRTVAKAEFHAETAGELRRSVIQLAEMAKQTRRRAVTALEKLTVVDKASEQILERAKDGQAFSGVLGPVGELLAAAESLPELEPNQAVRDFAQENIVIIEAGDKTEVVSFDDVWPLKVRSADPGVASAQPAKRAFNGDAAISSRILSMTRDPFATVLLTYYAPPPELARMSPPADIAVADLSVLRRRLESANFKVEEWNLRDEMPSGQETGALAMLVLPPPPSIPIGPAAGDEGGFSAEHVRKVREAIDAGIPAVFLASFMPPRQLSFFSPPVRPAYGFGDYLREQWGIDVQTDYLVIPAVADQNVPGQFKIDAERFSYLPLSTFSDHPVGRPLQAQRVLWMGLCPVSIARERPEGVAAQPILTVPGNWRSTWATSRIEEMLAQFQTTEGSMIAPDFEAGDLAPPFDVAVAAARAGDEQGLPVRIVALGVGRSLTDGYLDEPVGRLDADGTLSLTDPPKANADLVINSLYWLTGREQLIASGPAQVRPVKLLDRRTLTILKLLVLGVLPAAVVALGGLVLLVRRR